MDEWKKITIKLNAYFSTVCRTYDRIIQNIHRSLAKYDKLLAYHIMLDVLEVDL